MKLANREFNKEYFKQSFNMDQLSEIACVLNKWETPEELGLPRKLTESEVTKLFNIVTEICPHNIWIKTWQARHTSKATESLTTSGKRGEE